MWFAAERLKGFFSFNWKLFVLKLCPHPDWAKDPDSMIGRDVVMEIDGGEVRCRLGSWRDDVPWTIG